MKEMIFEAADVERLAATLDTNCAALDDRDRTLLHGIFALAGQAAADEPEVSGFGSGQLDTTGSLFGSFQLGGLIGAGPAPISISKQVGAASPLELQSLATNENLDAITFVTRPNP